MCTYFNYNDFAQNFGRLNSVFRKYLKFRIYFGDKS